MLSRRGATWALTTYAHGETNSYDPVNNIDGQVSFWYAENRLMFQVMSDFINKNNWFDKQCCAYGEGYTGTLRLRTAMAKHMNTFFNPYSAFDAEQVSVTMGVTALNEACAMMTCDPGEAVMLGHTVYGAFNRDLTTRTGIQVEYAPTGDTEQFDVNCVDGFERGFAAARERGVDVKALIICNPHNPLGRCYSKGALLKIMHFCSSKGLHLISDEIYALSVYHRDDQPCESFTSIRAIDPTGIIQPDQLHVLYGMSKDFAAPGLGVGCIVSQNKYFTNATRAICRFASASRFSMVLAARVLEDQDFVKRFFRESNAVLQVSRMLAERLLEESGIPFLKSGNAGFFVWLDLSQFLPLDEVNDDGWEAERLLTLRFKQAGLLISTGRGFHCPKPGHFRIVFCIEEFMLREGIRRIHRVISQ